MANRFDIHIVAIDRFTKVLRNINKSGSEAIRPFSMMGPRLRALGKEMHLDKLGKGMQVVSRAAIGMSRSLGNALGPLEQMLGIGVGGGIVGALAAAAAGAMYMTTRVAQVGFETKRTARTVNLSTDELQRMRGAFKLFGLDTEAADGELQQFTQTMQDALTGRNPAALATLMRRGIGFKFKADGTIDARAMLGDVADSLKNIQSPGAQMKMATDLGLVKMLPLLREGATAMKNLEDEAERLGVVLGPEAIARADRFTESLNRMKVAAEGLGKSIATSLMPALTYMMDGLSDRVSGTGSQAEKGWLDRTLAWLPQHMIQQSAKDTARWLFGGPPVLNGGRIGEAGSVGGGPATSWRTGPRSWSGVIPGAASAPSAFKTNADMAKAVALTPEEQRRADDYDASAANLRELRAEIARQKAIGKPDNLANAAVLQQELNRITHIIVEFKNAPPGTSATVVPTAGDGQSPARIVYSMPTDVNP